MKQINKISLLSLFATVGVLGKTAIIDTERIIHQETGSLLARAEGAKLQQWLDARQKPIQDLSNKLNTKRQQLEERAKAGKQPTDAERDEYMAMLQDVQQQGQALEPLWQEKLQTFGAQLQEATAAAGKVVGAQLGYDQAQDKRAYIFYNPADDITDAVIKEMNAKYEAEKRAEKMKNAAAPAKAKL